MSRVLIDSISMLKQTVYCQCQPLFHFSDNPSLMLTTAYNKVVNTGAENYGLLVLWT